MWSRVRTSLFIVTICSPVQILFAIDPTNTRLVAEPAISESKLAFVYADDLWVANLDGNSPQRLTSHPGTETSPRFSPDGTEIAFSAEYDGNTDVFVVPVEGGVPKRLTWHPGPDLVWDYAPDGEHILFGSPRVDATGRHFQFFSVEASGSSSPFPEQLPIPHGFHGSYSPDGRKIAYNPQAKRYRQWKNYRGGTVSRIWIYDTDDHSVIQVPQPEGRSNDSDPMWIGDTLFFLSDRAGEFNLFSFELESGLVEQLTSHSEFPILNASSGAGRIAYEQAGYVHIFEPEGADSKQVELGLTADLQALRSRWVSGSEWIRSASISPSGARAAFEYRGEIVTVPAKKGDPRQLTHTPGAHEKDPAWSPDGKEIAYFSDASGEYELHIVPQDGRGEARIFAPGGAGFYDDLKWSPDGSFVSYLDNSWSLYVLELASGEVQKIHSEVLYGPIRTLHHDWSPDSKWLAYTRITHSYFQIVSLYSIEENQSHQLTDGLSDVGEPVFDASGKYLYFTGSTDAGPVRSWFAMSNADMQLSHNIYVAVLSASEPSPLAPESDEEDSPSSAEDEGDDDQEDDSDQKASRTVIDLDGLANRILTLPIEAGLYSNLAAADGKLFFLAADAARGRAAFGPTSAKLQMFELESRDQSTLATGVAEFSISADHQKILLRSRNSWSIADAGKKIDAKKSKIGTDAISVRVEPTEEWRQIFAEAWRINRDYFYDPNMHGADWPAMRERYAQFLPDLATRSDLNRVLQWMSSELAVGHHRVGGGDVPTDPDGIPGGLLGADFEIDSGHYRFARIFGGLNWNPDLRSPLTEPGVDVREGEYLLAVDGVELDASTNLYSRFENSAGRQVEITVGSSIDTSSTRQLIVVPIENEGGLRNRAWVESNLARVDEATDGRVAYVYVPNTTRLGHTYFKRYFFPQTHKQAIIIDERHNRGGQVADYYIDLLRRPYISHWATRYGDDFATPLASIQGPKVMLIDETAGSGGDLLPWMFRKLELGKLIGRPTWGGLVGTLGFPILVDGGRITAPNLGIWTEDGFIVENAGVPPDIEVEQWPAEMLEGQDPQLEKAIEVILEELRAAPPDSYQRPPFPIRARPIESSEKDE